MQHMTQMLPIRGLLLPVSSNFLLLFAAACCCNSVQNASLLGAAGVTTLSPVSMTTIAHGLRTTGAMQPGVTVTALPVAAMQMRKGGDGGPCRHATIGGLHRPMRGVTTGAARAYLPGTTSIGACPLTGRRLGSTRSGDPQQTVTLTGFSSDHPHPRQVRRMLPLWPTGL